MAASDTASGAASGQAGLSGFARNRFTVVLAVLVALVLAAVAAIALWRLQGPSRTVTAHFTRTVGIYPDSEVRILGVKVGQVIEVVPEGRTVKVVMAYDADYQVPEDVKAVVVPPSLVSDRYVQLAPAYTGGPILPDDADLPVDRTIVPMELDQVYKALDDLAKALGPEGANSTGELSRLLSVGRENLEGNGEQLGQTLQDLSRAMETLSDGRHDLFGTIDNLQAFTTVLAESDREVRRFNRQLADVAEQLAGERDELAAALRNLGIALGQVARFVKDNREALVSNVDGLTDVTAALVRQKEAMIKITDVLPVGLANLALSYNPRSGTTDTRNNLMGPYDPAVWVCSLMVHVLPEKEIPDECTDLAKMLQANGAKLTVELAKLLGGSVPAPEEGGGGAGKRPVGPSGEMQSSDPTMGGILGGSS